jgi:CheY-like chemotaxis protein
MNKNIKAIKVLLVDDHKIVRDGIISLLQGEENIQIVGQAENGLEAIDKIGELSPDLVLLDINMPLGEYGDEHIFYNLILPYNYLGNLFAEELNFFTENINRFNIR